MGFRAWMLAAALLLLGASLAVACVPARTFGGYDCAADCAFLAAGYRWAEERDVDEPKQCAPGLSESFYKGCLVYVSEPDRSADVDDQGGPIDDLARRSRIPD